MHWTPLLKHRPQVGRRLSHFAFFSRQSSQAAMEADRLGGRGAPVGGVFKPARDSDGGGAGRRGRGGGLSILSRLEEDDGDLS